ncbi:MAG TPA: hypothetical protein VGZ26_10950 [Pirellulales bacterium]|nr:hypothetical protein [Pirellulales bacterium]
MESPAFEVEPWLAVVPSISSNEQHVTPTADRTNISAKSGNIADANTHAMANQTAARFKRFEVRERPGELP